MVQFTMYNDVVGAAMGSPICRKANNGDIGVVNNLLLLKKSIQFYNHFNGRSFSDNGIDCHFIRITFHVGKSHACTEAQ